MKIILDCDPGNGIPGANVDDAVALTYAVCEEACDLVAVWTVFGNTSAAEGEAAAHTLLDELDAKDVVVRRGSAVPLSGEAVAWRTKLDAPSQHPEVYSLWGVQSAPVRYGRGERLADDELHGLIEDLQRAGDGVVLACIGPLTNVARLIHDRPEALAGVERIALMGGCLGEGDLVDTNFAVDPEAARIVLESGIPLTIVPLDVTRTTELSMDKWRDLRELGTEQDLEGFDGAQGGRHADAAAIGRWLEPWITYSAATRPVNGMWLHDLVVVAQLVDPMIVSRRRAMVSVAPSGKLIEVSGKGEPSAAAGASRAVEVDLVTTVDNDRLVDRWVRAVLGV
ncbi:nucleoside hydrolase [Arcanobacterium haemolyticum]|nr:nucleoside hydrolase [Arcanobacterium haemolyticum]